MLYGKGDANTPVQQGRCIRDSVRGSVLREDGGGKSLWR